MSYDDMSWSTSIDWSAASDGSCDFFDFFDFFFSLLEADASTAVSEAEFYRSRQTISARSGIR